MADNFAVAAFVLASAVADAGTVTVGYPSGTSQKSFNYGLAGPGSYALVNDNDKWAQAASKIGVTYGASNITLTNNSGTTWAAGSSVRLHLDQKDDDRVHYLTFPVKLSKVTAADVVTNFRPGINGTLESVQFVVTDPVTTAAKAATISPWIDGVVVTGGALALTSATATPLGANINSSAEITAANTLTRESQLSFKATSVTAFVEGEGIIVARIRRSLA